MKIHFQLALVNYKKIINYEIFELFFTQYITKIQFFYLKLKTIRVNSKIIILGTTHFSNIDYC